MITKITDFLKEVLVEAKKVTWPTSKEVFRYTLLVIGLSVFLALFLGGVDLLFTTFLNRIIIKP